MNASTRHLNWRSVLDTTASVMMIAAATVMLVSFVRGGKAKASVRPDPPLPTSPLTLDAVVQVGELTAPVVIVEYADFQCPYCGAFHRETWPGLETKYVKPGRLQFVFINDPLQMHEHAERAAEAAVCAAQQGKGWEMHNAMFADQGHLDEPSLLSHAVGLGLERTQFGACLSGGAASRVKIELAEATAVQATATPAFLVGTRLPDGRVRALRRISGNRPAADFDAAIDAVLKTAGR